MNVIEFSMKQIKEKIASKDKSWPDEFHIKLWFWQEMGHENVVELRSLGYDWEPETKFWTTTLVVKKEVQEKPVKVNSRYSDKPPKATNVGKKTKMRGLKRRRRTSVGNSQNPWIYYDGDGHEYDVLDIEDFDELFFSNNNEYYLDQEYDRADPVKEEIDNTIVEVAESLTFDDHKGSPVPKAHIDEVVEKEKPYVPESVEELLTPPSSEDLYIPPSTNYSDIGYNGGGSGSGSSDSGSSDSGSSDSGSSDSGGD